MFKTIRRIDVIKYRNIQHFSVIFVAFLNIF